MGSSSGVVAAEGKREEGNELIPPWGDRSGW